MHSQPSPADKGDKADKADKGDTLRSVRRALDALDLLAQFPDGLLVKSISHKLHLNISTTYHLLNTLLEAGYAERDPRTLLVRLGPKAAYLGDSHARHAAESDLVSAANPSLTRLAGSVHAASYLAAWENGDAVIQAIVEDLGATRIPGLYVGYSGASHVHALGRTLLSFASPDVLACYLEECACRGDAVARADERSQLSATLAVVRAQGFALDLEGLVGGTCCVSAPVLRLDRHGDWRPVAAVAVSLPATRFQQQRDRVIREVTHAGAEIARALTARPAFVAIPHSPDAL